MGLSPIHWRSWRLDRVARSSLSAEIQAAADNEDDLWMMRLMWAELNGVICEKEFTEEAVKQTGGYLICDAKGMFDAVHNSETTALGLKEKRSGIELLGLRENMELNGVVLKWVNSDAMLANGMTKKSGAHQVSEYLRTGRWKVVYDEAFTSAKKRKAVGKKPMDAMVGAADDDNAKKE